MMAAHGLMETRRHPVATSLMAVLTLAVLAALAACCYLSSWMSLPLL